MLRSFRKWCRRIWRIRSPLIGLVAIILALGVCVPMALGYARTGDVLRRISREDLRVTNGAVVVLRDGALEIDASSSRAVVRTARSGAGDQAAQIRFRYLGPSKADKPLASGELRRQIGLKLHAADSCNVIYVMWRIAPDTGIAVSAKRNAAHSHAQCGVQGYETIAPQRQAALRAIQPGEVRTLRAELRGRTLTVLADGKLVWQGIIAGELPAGPPGFRTDNARFKLEYFIP
jgi:hypothetical protein